MEKKTPYFSQLSCSLTGSEIDSADGYQTYCKMKENVNQVSLQLICIQVTWRYGFSSFSVKRNNTFMLKAVLKKIHVF